MGEATEENNVIKERAQGEWKSVYPPEVRSRQKRESYYLFVHLIIFLVLSGVIWLFPQEGFLGLNSEGLAVFKQYILAWCGGSLGGTAFSLKWLYHAIAKMAWHEDRMIWRFCTPHLSGLFAISFFALLNSGLLNIVIEHTSLAFAFAFGFLVGYFSDRAAAKMKDIADSLFGSAKGKQD